MKTRSVASLIIDVCDRVVMPRFERLASHEVTEKSPGDLVTVADREAEAEITAVLHAAYSAALVIGEESVADDPTLRGLIDASEHVWLIDPVDGTGNFVAGNPLFGSMVVELRRGVPVRSWIWQAVQRRMVEASSRDGAYVNGVQLRAPVGRLRPELVGGVTPEYAALRGPGLAVPLPMTGSCAFDYPLMALDERDYLIHNGSHPWDHWPGILLLECLGGHVAFLDGEPFTSTSPNPHKILAARSREVWETVAQAARRVNLGDAPYPEPLDDGETTG